MQTHMAGQDWLINLLQSVWG